MPRKPNEHKSSIRARIADAIDISKDVILDTFLLRTTGTQELIIENYKGILEYSNESILIKATPSNIKICGSELEIKTITDEMLFVYGDISNILFVTA